MAEKSRIKKSLTIVLESNTMVDLYAVPGAICMGFTSKDGRKEFDVVLNADEIPDFQKCVRLTTRAMKNMTEEVVDQPVDDGGEEDDA